MTRENHVLPGTGVGQQSLDGVQDDDRDGADPDDDRRCPECGDPHDEDAVLCSGCRPTGR